MGADVEDASLSSPEMSDTDEIITDVWASNLEQELAKI